MTSTTPNGLSNTNPVRLGQVNTGHFMLTLCPLAAPVSIRPPQSVQLKPFTFFVGRTRQPDGSARFYLHMGYFETLADAERCLGSVRRRYPDAFATLAPFAPLRPAHPDAHTLLNGASQSTVSESGGLVPLDCESLTDTQVLKILETRRLCAIRDAVDESHCGEITLLGPDDTSTRQALKDAVIQGAAVSFAVQLHWSAQPIDLRRLPSLPLFKAHTLYATESRRKGRSRHFLRLGFFADPVSAKQVAVQVRSTFASAAVVPVVEEEITRAREAGTGASAIPYLAVLQAEAEIGSGGTSESPMQSQSLRKTPPRVSRSAERARPMQPLSDSEMWTDPDSLSESGVRHLRVEMQDHSSRRWRTVRNFAAD
jgi:hypothetical protein